MTEPPDQQRIVRVLAFALRHQPGRFGVALDDEGYAALDDLVVGIRHSDYDWAALDVAQVVAAIHGTDAGRFEVRDGRVRACYGHSVALGTPGEPADPPAILFHGTAVAPEVLAAGLRPMGRALVHLTSDPDYAAQVAAAKGGGVVRRVRAREAATAGVAFFRANAHVWLAREVPAEYLMPNDLDPGGGRPGGHR